MPSTRTARATLRHLANLLAPGLVFLPSFVAFIQFQGYPLWRPEVLITAGVLLAAGSPFGLLLSLRPRTFGAAAMTLLLFAWATQFFAAGVVDLLAVWTDVRQSFIDLAGPYGGLAVSFLIDLFIVLIPFLALSWLGKNQGIVLATVFR